MTTPRLGAPELVSGQATPETTVNEQIRYIESGAGHFIFVSRVVATPPGSPADGDCYLIAASPTGAWAGQAGKIAFRVNTAWAFITPIEGFTAWVNDENAFIGYDGAAWNVLASPSGTYVPLTYLDTDGALAANSDTKIATQKAVRTYVASKIVGMWDLRGATDCSANPNYPAAVKGDAYVVTVAGKVGGASGTSVNAGDVYFATADNAGGTQAAVGASWDTIVHTGVAAGGGLLAANNLSDVASAVAAKDNISKKGADIASAATTDLSAATGDFINVTGTTTITALGTCAAGVERTVKFAGALTLTYNATSLILPTAANITTAAGDVAVFRSLGSGNWQCVGYSKASGSALAGSGSSITAKDEGTTLTSGMTSINFVGGGVVATASGTDVTVTIAGAGSADVPSTIKDLLFWFEPDNYNASSGAFVQILQNKTPWLTGFVGMGTNGGSGATIDSGTLNGYPVINTAGSAAARYGWNLGATSAEILKNCTAFVVLKPNAVGANQAFFGGSTGALEFRIETTGALGLVQAGTAAIGTSTTTVSAGTWYQVNVTYSDSTGAYAFRVARATAGSGTNVKTIAVSSGGILYNNTSVTEDLNCKVAAIIIYNRVLTGPEITSVENYLNSKYGV